MEHRIEDIGITPRVMKILLENKKELIKLANPDNYGRKKKLWCGKTYGKFATILTRKMADHLVNSDRIESPSGRFWQITGTQSKKFVNWHTDGLSFSIKITGLPGNYGIKMSGKRKKEMKERIESGQAYHKL